MYVCNFVDTVNQEVIVLKILWLTLLRKIFVRLVFVAIMNVCMLCNDTIR